MTRRDIITDIITDTLAAARDVNDAMVIEACKRALKARTAGRKMGEDYQMVLAFAA